MFPLQDCSSAGIWLFTLCFPSPVLEEKKPVRANSRLPVDAWEFGSPHFAWGVQ